MPPIGGLVARTKLGVVCPTHYSGDEVQRSLVSKLTAEIEFGDRLAGMGSCIL